MTLEIKSIDTQENDENQILSVMVRGKLKKQDYDMLMPEMEKVIDQYGKMRLLIELRDFHGWSASAAWKDTKLGVKHFKDIERLAIVGENRWEKGMAFIAKPFTMAKVHYFDIAERDNAERWLKENI